jgi:hypothetical protein
MHRECRSTGELIEALREERQAQGLSCDDVDHIAGLPDRYTNKIENWAKTGGRGIGLMSLPLLLRVLGLKLIIATDPDNPPARHGSRKAIAPHHVTHVCRPEPTVERTSP